MKSYKQSKTIIANILMAMLVIVDQFGTKLIPPEVLPYIIGGVNVILRVITKEPLKW